MMPERVWSLKEGTQQRSEHSTPLGKACCNIGESTKPREGARSARGNDALSDRYRVQQ